MTKDKILRCTGEKVELRFVLVDATQAANTIGARHGAQSHTLELLGKTMVSSLLLASCLKFKGVVQVRYHFTGDISFAQADATPAGLVRAMIPKSDLDKVGNFEPVFLEQTMLVRKLDEHGKQIMQSIIEMPSKQIGKAFAAYLLQSEQTRSAVGIMASTGVSNSELKYCVGFLVEALPKVDNETLSQVEKSIQSLGKFSAYCGPAGFNLEQLLKDLAGPYSYQIHKEFPVSAYCPCARQSVIKSLETLGLDTLNEIIKGREVTEVFCDFCREQYLFKAEEMQMIAEALKNRKKNNLG